MMPSWNQLDNEVHSHSADSTQLQHWTFVDVTEEVGLDVNNRRFTWAAGWEDIDKDGDLDAITCEESDNLGVFWYENPLK